MFKNARILSGINSWKKISGESIDNRAIVIKNMKNFERSRLFDETPFEINSRLVKIERCDVDFQNYNLSPILFPKVKILYLNCTYVDIDFIKTWDRYAPLGFCGFISKRYKKVLELNNIKRWYPVNNFDGL